jgi:hypothetical protein
MTQHHIDARKGVLDSVLLHDEVVVEKDDAQADDDEWDPQQCDQSSASVVEEV